MENLKTLVNQDRQLERLGRWVTLTFVWAIGEKEYLVSLDRGRVADVRERLLPIDVGLFIVRASDSTWRKHWERLPEPEFHDLFSMLSAGHASLDGDIKPLMQNLLYFKTLLAAPRDCREMPS